MPDPLALSCFCPGDTSISGCTLTGLKFHASGVAPAGYGYGVTRVDVGLYGLSGSPPTLTFGTGDGPVSMVTDLDVSDALANWGALSIHVSYSDSSLQPLDGDKSAPFSCSFYIEQLYTCVNPDTGETTSRSVAATNSTGGTNKCTVDGVVRGIVSVGPGAGGGVLLNSSSFSPCGSLGSPVEQDGGGFAPTPANDTIDTNTSSAVCLCATGGAGGYTFSVDPGSSLPSGQTLNSTSGCIEGTADGVSNGSSSITFRVTDREGNEATVDCNLVTPCDCDDKAATGGNSFY